MVARLAQIMSERRGAQCYIIMGKDHVTSCELTS